MKVYDVTGVILGYCNIKPEKIKGQFLVTALAQEGAFCKACGIKHTFFSEIRFGVRWKDEDTYLVADPREDVAHLPGFVPYHRQN